MQPGTESPPPNQSKKKYGMTTEQKTADTILQRTYRVRIGGRSYRARRPSLGALIELSEHVSLLPRFSDEERGTADIVSYAMSQARYCRPLADIAVIVLLGSRSGCPVWLLPLYALRATFIRRRFMRRATGGDLSAMVSEFIKRSQVGDFFASTAFLSALDMTRETKAGTTASGRQ